mgnify:CR=1 FL=1
MENEGDLSGTSVDQAEGRMSSQEIRALTKRLMRRQVKLSLAVTSVFVVILLGLPLLNVFAKEAMATNIGGISLTWWILGVLFYPLTWGLSQWFVHGSEKIEAEIVREEKGL